MTLANEAGKRITDLITGKMKPEEVFESPASIVFDEAENGLHSNNVIMIAIFGE